MTRLRESYPKQNLRVTIEPQEEGLLPDMSAFPHTVTSEAHLIELLRQSLSSPTQEVTDETWEQKRLEVRRRAANRQ
ncbi:MAG: hypothetical protein ACRYFS_12105 [Janthinobacterium lividum]